jgi:hypothetical protein
LIPGGGGREERSVSVKNKLTCVPGGIRRGDIAKLGKSLLDGIVGKSVLGRRAVIVVTV